MKYFIEYWWDRFQKYYVITVYDSNDVEQEDVLEPSKSYLQVILKELCEKYHTDDVRRIVVSNKERNGD